MATVKYSTKTGKKLKKGETTSDSLGNTYKQGDTFGSPTGGSSSKKAANDPSNVYNTDTGALNTNYSGYTPTPVLTPYVASPAPASNVYTPTSNNVAAYGENSPAVLALQKQLNAKNAGQSGYIPLKEDSLYGPLTAAAMAFKPTNAAASLAEPTAADIYSYGGDINTPEYNRALQDEINFNKDLAEGDPVVDESKIRSDTLRSFQAEIDAQNAIFADKLREARVAGAGRIGSDTAIQARRGLLGSSFGAGQSNRVTTENANIESGISNEQRATVASILTRARTAGDAAIAAKTAAKKEGLNAYIKNLSESASRKTALAKSIALDMIAKSTDTVVIDPNKMDEETFNGIAIAAGVTPESIKSAYAPLKKEADEKAVKAAAEVQKALSEGRYYEVGGRVYDKDNNFVTNAVVNDTPSDTETKNKIIADGEAKLNAARGADGWTDPYLYQQAYDGWVSGGLGTAAQFLTRFPPKNYVNPAATNLPEYLRNKTKTTERTI